MSIVRIGIYSILGIIGALVMSPLIIKETAGAKQPIYEYVDNHNSKQGTPTMGGLIFLFSACLIVLVSNRFNSLGSVAAVVTLAYGAIGFTDDFLKIKTKHNLGLKPYQKLVAQTLVAIAVAVYCYLNQNIGSVFKIPFSEYTVDLSYWAIPIYILILVAMTNSVNLTDGLDGLAASTSSVYFTTFTVILLIMINSVASIGDDSLMTLAAFSAAFAGALIAFVVVNSFPAKIFMGDTGSLAIGAGAACVAMFSGNSFYLPIIGIVYLITALSVIIQVIVFKLVHRRVFLMAPIHHHFERKGIHENKIVSGYFLVSVLVGIICIIFYA